MNLAIVLVAAFIVGSLIGYFLFPIIGLWAFVLSGVSGFAIGFFGFPFLENR